MQELVKRNLRFVISVAKKYQNRGLPLTDLIGEGNVGLLTAARKFDPDQGVKFISYAVWWIRQAILASLARQGRTVRVPLNRTADLSRIIRTAETLRQELRREPTPEEIAASTGLSLDVVQSLAALNTSDVRLDAPLDPEGDRSLIERFVADEHADTEEQAMDRFLSDEIEQALTHAAAARRQGAPALLRPRRRPRAHARGDRRHARRHPRAGAPAARPRAQAAARRRGRPGAGELRGVSRTFRLVLRAVATRVAASGRLRRHGSAVSALETGRALADVRTWRPLLLGQMRRLGVDSVPIAIFIAVFTGIVLVAALLLHLHRRRAALLRRRAGRQDGDDGAGPGAHRHGARRPRRRQHRRRAGHDEGDRAGRRARDPGLRPERLPRGAPRARGHAHVSGGHRLRHGRSASARGWITSINLLDLSTHEFVKGLSQFYQFKDIWFGLVKSASFGGAVALMGCLEGIATQGGAEGVGPRHDARGGARLRGDPGAGRLLGSGIALMAAAGGGGAA